MITILQRPETKYSLDYYAGDPIFSGPVADLKTAAKKAQNKLQGRTIWMINSTAQGGGVAEMLPGLITLMNDLGIDVKWGVINSDDPEFFLLTKRIHNLIHGDETSNTNFTEDDAQLFESINRKNAEKFKTIIKKGDILVIHDPQPMPLGKIIAEEFGLLTIWRCHIGLDRHNNATDAAWDFLKKYAPTYTHSIFTAPEYVPDFFQNNYSIIHPCIDPLSHKNQDLTVTKLTGILCNSGLLPAYEPIATPDYEARIKKFLGDGTTGEPGETGLLFRPVITQISRWDRLKGWLPLLDGFIKLKQENIYRNEDDTNSSHIKRLQLSRLVLAGPDPTAVSDDPEGLEVVNQVRERFISLDSELQKDITILLLPMESAKENSLIVNALQRCATVIVQNSIQEGFGLTATEAMWKRKPVLVSSASGLKQQVSDNINGLMVMDPEDPFEISECLRKLITNPGMAYNLGRNAQRSVYDHFLIFRQITQYLELFMRLL
ncbi:MAG: glycosyltransferase [Spirochaetes bacterium]|jgi:trehalose synthase|nr:glycosyltransferase [Spirochaetota bacterium]